MTSPHLTGRPLTYADLTPAEVYDLSQIAPPRFHATLHTPEGFAELVRLLRGWWTDAERRLAEHGRARFTQDLAALEAQHTETTAAAEAASERFRELDRVRGTAILEAIRRNGVERMSLSDFVAEGDWERHLQQEHDRLRDHLHGLRRHAHTLRCQSGVNWAVLNRYDQHGDTEAPRFLRLIEPEPREAMTTVTSPASPSEPKQGETAEPPPPAHLSPREQSLVRTAERNEEMRARYPEYVKAALGEGYNAAEAVRRIAGDFKVAETTAEGILHRAKKREKDRETLAKYRQDTGRPTDGAT